MAITLTNNLASHVFSAKDHPGIDWLLSVNAGYVPNLEFGGTSSCYQQFQRIALGGSATYAPQASCLGNVTINLTVMAPFQVSQSKSNIPILDGMTASLVYFIPNWAIAQANYGLVIGSQPIIDLGFAAQVQ